MQVNSIKNNNLYFNSQKLPQNKEPELPKNTGSEIKNIFLGLGAIGTIMAVLLKSNPVKLSNIEFDKGIASLNGKKFTGTVQDVLKSGDSITLKYKNGIIQSSKKVTKGGETIEKYWQYFDDGSYRIGTFSNNIARHASFKTGEGHKGPAIYSVIEEDFNKNTRVELARFNQDASKGSFINTKKDGSLVIGEKQDGNWTKRFSTKEQEGLNAAPYIQNGVTIQALK